MDYNSHVLIPIQPGRNLLQWCLRQQKRYVADIKAKRVKRPRMVHPLRAKQPRSLGYELFKMELALRDGDNPAISLFQEN